MSKEPFDTGPTKKIIKSTLRSLKAPGPGEEGFIDTKSITLNARQWRDMREGIIAMGDFLRAFPDGIKGLIKLVKEDAKSQIGLSITGLLRPITNEIDSIVADISGELGLTKAVNKIKNQILEQVGELAKLLTLIIGWFTDLKTIEKNIKWFGRWVEYALNYYIELWERYDIEGAAFSWEHFVNFWKQVIEFWHDVVRVDAPEGLPETPEDVFQ